MSTPTCMSCRHWQAIVEPSEDGKGECFRHPPRIVGAVFSRIALLEGLSDADSSPDFMDRARATVWPVTFGGNRCGEWDTLVA
ncbi:MAG: hypothetical protein JOY99_11090 [Sphingomonadaceae bacterium]|nr:hypothetical protein [Sphingomonadaceae bacterium]